MPSCGPWFRKNGTSAPIVAASSASRTAVSGSGRRSFASRQRGSRVGAAAAEPGGDGDRLLDLDLPARLDARDGREGLQRLGHDRVVGEPGHRKPISPTESATVSASEIRCSTVTTSCLPSVAERADDEREVDLRVRL